MPRIFLAFLISFTISTAAAQPDCDTALFSRFTQLVIRSHDKLQLGIEQIEKMSQSPVPLDPYAHVVGDSKTSVLKDVFAENIRRLPADQWPAIQRELKTWLTGAKKQHALVEDARVRTQDLFLPQIV